MVQEDKKEENTTIYEIDNKKYTVITKCVENVQNVIIKEENSIRTNIIITKIKQTPLTYPRPKNLPKTNPIV